VCKRMKRLSVLGALFLASTIGTRQLQAQATASISGTITDTSGAALADAIVKLTNMGTGVSRSIATDSQGRYRIPDLAIGDYDMEAAKPGFETVVHKGVTLTVGSDPVVNASLPLGQTQQTVEVTTDVSGVETNSSAITSLVDQTQMRELPLNGRDYSQLMSLAPGVIALPNLQTNTLFGNQPDFSASGMRPTGGLFLLDNTDTTGYFQHGGGSGALGSTLGVDAIDQFQVLTNTYSAEYGGAGTVVNSSTKSGTNAFHGSAYEFIRNSAIESRSFFDGNSVPPYRQNQFGATLGGPIKKDKAFFFINYEGFRASETVSNVAVVPDAEAHNFLMPNSSGVYVPVPQSTNPVTATAIRQVLALYPVATTEIYSNGLPTGTGFYTELNNTTSYENYLVARFDYQFSAKDSFFSRYVLDRASRDVDSLLHTDPELDLTRDNYATAEERHIFSPTLLNLARFSFVRNNEQGQFPKIIPVLQFYPGEGRQDGIITIGSNISSITSGPAFYVIPNKFTESDELIWTHGGHTVKAGASAERRRENAWNPGGIMGTWTFGNLTSFLEGVPLSVSGAPSDTQFPGLDAVKDWREADFGFYIQDDWKVSRRLTLNLGLRYEPTTDPNFALHQPEVLLNTPYSDTWTTVKNALASNVSLLNIDPRIGLAWDPFADQKTSIRAGFGIFHSLVFASEIPMYQQPPYFRVNQTAAQGATFPIMFSNIPANGAVVPTNGTLSCTVCSYYDQTRTPTIYQYNLSIQRELSPSTVLTVTGVGSHGNFLMMEHDFNYAVPFIGADGNEVFGTLVNGNIVLNPRLNPTWNALDLQNGQASSHYEALQVGVDRRLSKGLQTQISYSLSKSMDDASSGIGGFGDEGGTNPTDLRADYGLSNFNRTNNFRISSVYRLPFHASNAFANAVVKDWQLSAIYSYNSGQPFSPSVGFASTGTGGYTPRPNVIAGCNFYPAQQSVSDWFNTSCFTAPPIGEFGNAGRTILIGPNLWNLDSSLSREARITKVSEDFVIQFRAEFFNVLNHPNFGNPSGSLWNQGSDGTFVPNPSATQITTTVSNPRQIQFGLKIRF
jgi:Carboxypeptidase regulatory-like domain/TonB-dependent Receptor Plug Domain/TonB dependent receptor